MRTVTIARKKSFVGCLGVMKVYIEDATSTDLTVPVYVNEQTEENINFRKVGELKNGQEISFEADNEAARVMVIADRVSKDWCNDCYRLPEGDEDILLTGRNIFNPTAGNPFRFDGNDMPEAIGGRKKSSARGIAIFILALLVGFGGGYGITSLIFGIIDSQPKDFTAGQMTITLDEGFTQQNLFGYSAVYASENIIVFVNKDTNVLPGATEEKYAQSLIRNNGLDCKLERDGELYRFIYDATENNGNEYKYYAYVYENNGAFWLVQFSTLAKNAKKYADDIEDFAKSVKFE